MFDFISLLVLNARAVQMVLNKETNQLHRTLVTNFSFMDFPLQDSTHTLPTPSLQAKHLVGGHTPLPHSTAASTSTLGVTITQDDAWAAQFFNFDKQLSGVITSQQDPFVRDMEGQKQIDDASLAEQSQSGVRHSLDSSFFPAGVAGDVSSTSVNAVTLDSLASEIEKEADVAAERVQDSVIKPQMATPKPKSTPSVKANILKTKSATKPKAKSVEKRTSLTRPDHDILGVHEMLDDGLQEADELTCIQTQKAMSKQEIQRLKKARADKEKYQSNPAKFSHIFNQELLAYVDACCFAGLVSFTLDFYFILFLFCLFWGMRGGGGHWLLCVCLY